MNCIHFAVNACNNDGVRGVRCVGEGCRKAIPLPPPPPPKRIIKEDVDLIPQWLRRFFRKDDS